MWGERATLTVLSGLQVILALLLPEFQVRGHRLVGPFGNTMIMVQRLLEDQLEQFQESVVMSMSIIS